MFIAALFTIAKNKSKLNVHQQMGKENVVHICSGILLGHKKELNNAICSNMDGLEFVTLSEVSQTEKDKKSCDIAYMWDLKKSDTNELIYKTEVEPQA